MPALATYWLGTICGKGYTQTEWRTLDSLLHQALAGSQPREAAAIESLADLRDWIQQNRHKDRQPPPLSGPPVKEIRPEALPLYVFRLLNEWVPAEVARLLVRQGEDGAEPGIPVMVAAKAIERLLVREHLSHPTLKATLSPALWSPLLAYPADCEILQDVVLFLLGRTDAPAAVPSSPELLYATPGAGFDAEYAEAVRHGTLTAAEELQVDISPSQTDELLKTDPVAITSAVVTMDGRLWQADRLQRGERDSIVYRAAGRLQIDYSQDHARMVVPWPEAPRDWPGLISFARRLEIFGREWHISRWEQDSEQSLLHLVCDGSLPVAATAPDVQTCPRACPAAIDMAWTVLERALADSFARGGVEPWEQLRRYDMIPLARGLFALAESLSSRRFRNVAAIDRRLQGIRYLSSQTLPVYGLTPWRVLPAGVRKVLLAGHIHGPLAGLLREVFEGVPDNRATSIAVKVPSGRVLAE